MIIVGRGKDANLATLVEAIAGINLEALQVVVTDSFDNWNDRIEELKRELEKLFLAVKKVVVTVYNAFKEAYALALSKENIRSKQVVRIYQRTKPKRIKKKKFKQLVGYLVDEMMV